jgi:hypothetical protein
MYSKSGTVYLLASIHISLTFCEMEFGNITITSYGEIIFFISYFFEHIKYLIQHCFIARPSNSTVLDDAGIEPRTVETLALTIRRSNHSAIAAYRYISSTLLRVFFRWGSMQC